MRLIKVLCCCIGFFAAPAWADTAARTLVVDGTGVVHAAPDLAILRFGVVAQGGTAGDAMAQVSAAMQAVLAQVSAAGIAQNDVQTTDLSLTPVYDRRFEGDGLPPVLGYQAGNRITVTVRDLDGLGDVLDALINDGVNQFQGIEFGLAAPRVALDEARALAVQDAQQKAALYAQAAGVTLGDVLMLSEGGGGGGPVLMQMDMARASVPIAQGQVSQTASVRLTYAIGD